MIDSTVPSLAARSLLALAVASGCVIPKSVGDGPGKGGSSGGEASAGATASVPAATDGVPFDLGGVTDGVPFDLGGVTDGIALDLGGMTDGIALDLGARGPCSGVSEFQCAEGVDCDGMACGSPFSVFDAQGCMRPRCNGSGDCDSGYSCLFPQDYGFCTSSGISCDDTSGTCECVHDPDCGGGHCLIECFGHSDAASCEDAGCDFKTTIEISETCECTLEAPACLRFPVGLGEVESGYYWHAETLTVVYFEAALWWSLPLGWWPCDDPGAPPACGCFDSSLPPECS